MQPRSMFLLVFVVSMELVFGVPVLDSLLGGKSPLDVIPIGDLTNGKNPISTLPVLSGSPNSAGGKGNLVGPLGGDVNEQGPLHVLNGAVGETLCAAGVGNDYCEGVLQVSQPAIGKTLNEAGLGKEFYVVDGKTKDPKGSLPVEVPGSSGGDGNGGLVTGDNDGERKRKEENCDCGGGHCSKGISNGSHTVQVPGSSGGDGNGRPISTPVTGDKGVLVRPLEPDVNKQVPGLRNEFDGLDGKAKYPKGSLPVEVPGSSDNDGDGGLISTPVTGDEDDLVGPLGPDVNEQSPGLGNEFDEVEKKGDNCGCSGKNGSHGHGNEGISNGSSLPEVPVSSGDDGNGGFISTPVIGDEDDLVGPLGPDVNKQAPGLGNEFDGLDGNDKDLTSSHPVEVPGSSGDDGNGGLISSPVTRDKDGLVTPLIPDINEQIPGFRNEFDEVEKKKKGEGWKDGKKRSHGHGGEDISNGRGRGINGDPGEFGDDGGDGGRSRGGDGGVSVVNFGSRDPGGFGGDGGENRRHGDGHEGISNGRGRGINGDPGEFGDDGGDGGRSRGGDGGVSVVNFGSRDPGGFGGDGGENRRHGDGHEGISNGRGRGINGDPGEFGDDGGDGGRSRGGDGGGSVANFGSRDPGGFGGDGGENGRHGDGLECISNGRGTGGFVINGYPGNFGRNVGDGGFSGHLSSDLDVNPGGSGGDRDRGGDGGYVVYRGFEGPKSFRGSIDFGPDGFGDIVDSRGKNLSHNSYYQSQHHSRPHAHHRHHGVCNKCNN